MTLPFLTGFGNQLITSDISSVKPCDTPTICSAKHKVKILAAIKLARKKGFTVFHLCLESNVCEAIFVCQKSEVNLVDQSAVADSKDASPE